MIISPERVVPAIEPPFVVFLFGVRINNYFKVHNWLPVTRALKSIFTELQQSPDSGFMGQEYWRGNPRLVVQYWRTLEELQRYARSKDKRHFPAWLHFNENVSKTRTVGIWHEAYLIKEGCYEAVYKNMPEFGLAKAGGSRLVDGPKIELN